MALHGVGQVGNLCRGERNARRVADFFGRPAFRDLVANVLQDRIGTVCVQEPIAIAAGRFGRLSGALLTQTTLDRYERHSQH